MKTWIKIALLLMAIFPIWLTIVALADEGTTTSTTAIYPLNFWKDRINTKLLDLTGKKVQITEILSRPDVFGSELATQDFSLDISSIKSRGTSDVSLKFSDTSGRIIRVVKITVKSFVEEKVAVTTHAMVRGEILQPDDFQVEWRAADQMTSSIVKPHELLGRVLKSNVPEGEMILDNRLEKEALISKGDRVRILVQVDGIVISGVGIAQEAGTRGQTIKLLNSDSKKEVLGVVKGVREVEVRI